MSFPSSVIINEVGPREGCQSESPPIATAAKIELVDALSETGVPTIELVAFVSRTHLWTTVTGASRERRTFRDVRPALVTR